MQTGNQLQYSITNNMNNSLKYPNQNYHYDFSLLPEYIEKLFSKLRIAVIYGGDKTALNSVIYQTHNTRSWKSYKIVAAEIQDTLKKLGFQQVFLIPEDMNLPENLQKNNIHLAWLNTGGVQGYNPVCHGAAILEMLGIPYVGHNPLYSSILDNKHIFKRELLAIQVKTATFFTWHPYPQGKFNPTDSNFQAAFGDYSGPFIVKPVSGRASLHVYLVDRVTDLPDIMECVYQATDNMVLVEKYLPGREFCVAVGGYVTCIGGKLYKKNQPFAFSALERIFEPGERIFTSMDQKPISGDRAKLITEAELKLKQDLLQLSQKVYTHLGLQSLIRIDIRTDNDGILSVLEANPKPDLKRPQPGISSLVALGLDEYKMSYEDLIISIFADRLDYLFSRIPKNIDHIFALL